MKDKRTRKWAATWTWLALLPCWAGLAVPSARADTVVIDGQTWRYDIDEETATVTGETPGSGDIVMPESLGGYPVTRIGDGAFLYHLLLTGMTIADGVTNIGKEAFCNLTNLSSVVIPGNVTSIGDSAFRGCNHLPDVTIPDSVTHLGSRAFDGCSSLTNAVIGGRVTSIGNYLFAGCSRLPCVTIPDGVTNIGNYAFYGCDDLTDIAIPGNVTHIGDDAFHGCGALENVTIPDSVTSLGAHVFQMCGGLTNVAIGRSVPVIGEYAFYGCSNLRSIIIPDSVRRIGRLSFALCDELMDVTIPDSVREIGYRAFLTCDGLTSITLPWSVTNIEYGAFQLTGLKTLFVSASWKGDPKKAAMLDNGALPDECEIIYSGPESPTTSTTPVAVPYAWLEEKAAGILAGKGGDYEAVAGAMASNGVNPVWECYVAGLEPEDGEAEFKTIFTWEDVRPKVSWTPNLNDGAKKAERVYTVEGKKELDDKEEWSDVTGREESWVEEEWRFFRVGVAVP